MFAITLLVLPACSPQATPGPTHQPSQLRPAAGTEQRAPELRPAAGPALSVAARPARELSPKPRLSGSLTSRPAGAGLRRLQLRVDLPSSRARDFALQRFACEDAAFARVQLLGLGIDATQYATGADPIDHLLPVSGCQIDASFAAISYGPARIVRIELFDAARAPIAGAVAQSVLSVNELSESIEISFRSSPGAELVRQLVFSLAPKDLFIASRLEPTALQSFFDAVMGLTGSFPDYAYTTHPSLVNIAAILADLRAANGDLSALDASNPLYKLSPGSVAFELSGLLGGESIEVRLDDPLSDNQTVNSNGTVNLSEIPPGNWNLIISGDGYESVSIPVTVVAGQPLLLTPVAIKPAAPIITAYSASTRWPGSPLTLNGTELRAGQADYVVTVGGLPATITGGDTDQLDITVPAGLGAGSHAVTVRLGTSDVTTVATQLNVVQPTISEMVQSDGIVGSEVILNGNNFSDVDVENIVTFGGQPVTVTAATPSQIKFNVPTGAYGVNAVSLKIYDSSVVSAGNFTVRPNITGFSPAATGRVGDTITVSGTGFDPDFGDNAISFNGTPVSVGDGSGDSLTFVVPAGAFGSQDVTVSSSSLSSAAASFGTIPTLAPLGDSSGNVGDTLIVSGTGFDPAFANNRVLFDGIEAVPSAGDGSNLTVAVPAGAFGNAAVTVKTANRSSTETPRTYTIVPSITGISPSSANVGGDLTITGTGFSANAADNAVLVGGKTITPSLATSDTLSLTIPAGAAGQTAVRVRTNGLSGPINAETNFLFSIVPILTGLSPNFGIIGSETTLTGSGFNPAGGNTVTFGGAHTATVKPGSISANGDSLIVFVPANIAGTISANLATTGGTSGNQSFTVVPDITSITPNSGAPGENVTIAGTGFGPIQSQNTVLFGGTPANIVAFATNSITVQVPAVSGAQLVTVTHTGVNRTSAGFSFTAGPSLTQVSPNFAQLGTSVTLTGTGFNQVDQVLFGSTPTSFTVNNDSSITATVPSGIYGNVNVTVSASGAPSGPQNFGVQAVLSPNGPTTVTPGQDLNFSIAGTDPGFSGIRSATVDGSLSFLASINGSTGSIHIFDSPPLPNGPYSLVVHFGAGDSTALDFCVNTCTTTP